MTALHEKHILMKWWNDTQLLIWKKKLIAWVIEFHKAVKEYSAWEWFDPILVKLLEKYFFFVCKLKQWRIWLFDGLNFSK